MTELSSSAFNHNFGEVSLKLGWLEVAQFKGIIKLLGRAFDGPSEVKRS